MKHTLHVLIALAGLFASSAKKASTASRVNDTNTSRTYYGTLNEGSRAQLDLRLNTGYRYYIRGRCDDWCDDLDFILYRWIPPQAGRAGWWYRVTDDLEANAVPIVDVSPPWNAYYRLVIIMASCSDDPCAYEVDVS